MMKPHDRLMLVLAEFGFGNDHNFADQILRALDTEPDYWTRFEHQAALAFAVAHRTHCDSDPRAFEWGVGDARALIAELRKGEET